MMNKEWEFVCGVAEVEDGQLICDTVYCDEEEANKVAYKWNRKEDKDIFRVLKIRVM